MTVKKIVYSRGSDVDLDICVNNIGNRYDMVLVAAQRSKEIKRQNKSSIHRHHIFPNVTALLEIQENKVGREYLSKVRGK